MYVLMSDGSKIQTRFEKWEGFRTYFTMMQTNLFRADHVRFELESPIDVAEIQNWSLQGITAESMKGGPDRHLIQFDFGPCIFKMKLLERGQLLLEEGLSIYFMKGPRLSGPFLRGNEKNLAKRGTM